jgi:hypothetical protein
MSGEEVLAMTPPFVVIASLLHSVELVLSETKDGNLIREIGINGLV